MQADSAAQSARSFSGPCSTLALEFVATPSGGLVPTQASTDGVERMQPFQALQTILAAQIAEMPMAEFRWVTEYQRSKILRETAAAAATSAPSAAVCALAPAPPASRRLPSGAVRPIRRGVWVSPEREDAFFATVRASLHAAVLDALKLPSSTSPRGRKHSGGIPKLIHQIWLGGSLPPREAEWSKSWSRLHPESSGWKYKLWTDDDLPSFPLCERLTDAASAFLAGHLRALLPRCTNPAQTADLLRLDILWTEGGVYVDTDFEALAALSPFHEGGAWAGAVEFYAGLSNVGVVEINNGLLASVPQHALIGTLLQGIEIESCSSSHPKHTAMQIIRTSGPGWFTQTCVKFLEEWAAKHHPAAGAASSSPGQRSSPLTSPLPLSPPTPPPLLFFPPQVFYPLPNSMRHLRLSADKENFYTPATFAIHHWSCSWQEKTSTAAANNNADASPVASTASDSASTAANQIRQAQRAAQLIAMAQALQPGGQATNAAAASAPSSSSLYGGASSSNSSLEPALLQKIAGFMKA